MSNTTSKSGRAADDAARQYAVDLLKAAMTEHDFGQIGNWKYAVEVPGRVAPVAITFTALTESEDAETLDFLVADYEAETARKAEQAAERKAKADKKKAADAAKREAKAAEKAAKAANAETD